MNLNLRQAIIERVHNKNEQELSSIIKDSIDSDERALPGLGVLFELIWRHSEPDVQQLLVSTLKAHLPSHSDTD